MAPSTLTADQQELLNERIDTLIQIANDRLFAQYPGLFETTIFDIEKKPGKRYIKLVCNEFHKADMRRKHGSVWAFVDKNTGDVYKPASFAAPAKHVRYKLFDDKSFEEAKKYCGWATGWLYMK